MARFLKGKKFLQKIKQPLEPNMCFFDEQCFCQHQAYNTQNNTWLTVSLPDVPRVTKTKFPVHILVFGVVSSNEHVMPPYIFEEDLRVNQNVCQKVLVISVKSWIEEDATGRPFVFQQDSAPASTNSEVAQKFSINV